MDSWIYPSETKNIPSTATPLEIFKKLWPDSFIEKLISENKKKAKNLILTVESFTLYLVCLLIMSVAPLSIISHYWSEEENGILGNAFIKGLGKFEFYRKSFQDINANLHIDSN